MLMDGNLWDMLLNMFGVWMLGGVVEEVWGGKGLVRY